MRASVLVQEVYEGFEVFEGVWVGEVAAFEVGEEGGEAGGCGDWKKAGTVGGGREEVEESGEEEPGCFFFWGETKELGVKGYYFLFSGGKGVLVVEMFSLVGEGECTPRDLVLLVSLRNLVARL